MRLVVVVVVVGRDEVWLLMGLWICITARVGGGEGVCDTGEFALRWKLYIYPVRLLNELLCFMFHRSCFFLLFSFFFF